LVDLYDGRVVTDQTLRLLRGLTVAIAAVTLPVAGHATAGGPVTISAPTVVVFLFVAALATTISSDEWTVLRIVAVLLPAQALVHVALVTGDAPHAAHLTSTGSESGLTSAVDPRMVLAHVLAVGAVIVWLRLAERALLQLIALAARIFCRVSAVAVPSTVGGRPAPSTRSWIPLLRTRTLRSRAPPVPSFV
jgi:hypothetical protein